MPLREYDCKACGRTFETLERAGEKPACPSCGSRRLVRRLSSFAPRTAAPAAACPPCAGSCPAPGAGGCCGGCACHHHP